MTVIAFPGRWGSVARGLTATPVPLAGTFQSPRGLRGHMTGTLRVRRLVIVPRGTFVAGVCTGALHDEHGNLIGVDSKRATIEADLERRDHGYAPVLRAFRLELMGFAVDVTPTACELALPPAREPSV